MNSGFIGGLQKSGFFLTLANLDPESLTVKAFEVLPNRKGFKKQKGQQLNFFYFLFVCY